MADMRAKMRLTSILRTGGGEELRFSAVSKSDSYGEDGLDENNTYAKFTPMAELKMFVANDALFGRFSPDEEFYIDFTKAGDA